MSTSVCFELTYDGLVAHRPGRIKDSQPLNTTETGDKRRLLVHMALKGFSLAALALITTTIKVYYKPACVNFEKRFTYTPTTSVVFLTYYHGLHINEQKH